MGARALLSAGFGNGEGELRGRGNVAALGDGVKRFEKGLVWSRSPDSTEDTGGWDVASVGEEASSAA